METKDNKTIMYICTQMRYLRPKYIHEKGECIYFQMSLTFLSLDQGVVICELLHRSCWFNSFLSLYLFFIFVSSFIKKRINLIYTGYTQKGLCKNENLKS